MTATCYRCGAYRVMDEDTSWNHSCNSLTGHPQQQSMIHATRQVFTPFGSAASGQGTLMTDLREHERAVRICDICGRDSFQPVWLAVPCGGFIAQPDRMVRCHGHFVAVASDQEAS